MKAAATIALAALAGLGVLVALAAVATLCGCSDHPDGWEFCTHVSKDSTPEQLLETERALMSNGYKRVRISTTTGYGYARAIVIRATKKEGDAK